MKTEQRCCTIIGAGEWNMQELHTERDYVIAVDGGFTYCRQFNIEPDMVIGDFDSLKGRDWDVLERIEQKYPGRVLRLRPEKDDTDMLAAIRQGLEKGFQTFRIYGGCGGRLDHTLANIQSLLYLKKNHAEGRLIDKDSSIFVVKNETVAFDRAQEGYMSLFALGQKAENVTLTGFKYPLEDYTLTNDFPIGISNEFTGRDSSITVGNGEVVVMLQKKI